MAFWSITMSITNIAWVEYCKRKNLKISQEEIVSRYGTSNIEFFDLLYGDTLSKEENG